MTERKLTAIDNFITQVDQALQTLFGDPVGSDRDNPSRQQQDGDLSSTDKAKSLCLMRVNHAGEVCAQALYQGQALTARQEATRTQMKQAAMEENDHLLWCRQRIRELGGHTSLLNPVWYTGSLALGAASGVIGDKWSLGFLAETEHQVVKHLSGHLQRLPPNDNKSRTILEQMREDEARHKATALAAGGSMLPTAVKKLMTLASRVMTYTAYRI
ncbi:MAG TPA: 2-polyprenyl-3-methyl-6-methoxy-1,4-benzoquinone monooxygenase [Gammaproteobacteria bacterium]|nr:2-polyprenyl-3-methyl-6-methoxy-1,4-benzoquinone monooxygenase [Gammaproteobacteria bacterium]